MFPPAPAASAFINFDGRGFLVNGKRTFIVSGSLHYPRVPRALWEDRLLKFKRAGFNTVQTYAFWNFHEPRQGEWDFTGRHDLSAFLKLAKQVGLYATVRVGPYVCAEWDSGGYPVWLRFVPGLRVREDNRQFMAANDQWFDHVFGAVVPNQIDRGGNVIMVQLENEDPQGWGTDMPNSYFQHLKDKAQALGLEVPFFFSGLHHGSDPGGNNPWDSKGRTNPWYSTEFWPGWYSDYGPLNAGDFRRFDRGDWKIIAYGGNGYNFYMLHGGTNFDTWNDNEVASSYDYSAAVGQAGDLRPIYYRFKRAATFATSFQDVLEDSENATDTFKSAATDPGIRVTARKSPAGTLLFLDNNSKAGIKTQVMDQAGKAAPVAGSFTIAAGQIVPVVLDYKLLPDVTLNLATSRIQGILRQGLTTTIVLCGSPGDPTEMRFTVAGAASRIVKGQAQAGGSGLAQPDASHFVLTAQYPAVGQDEYAFVAGKERIRILSMSDDLADRTWLVDAGGHSYVITGPHYVGQVTEQNGELTVYAQRAAKNGQWDPSVSRAVVYGEGPDPVGLALSAPAGTTTAIVAPLLSPWQYRRGDAEAQPGYNDAGWKASQDPLPMGADGDISAYAWYRATVTAQAAGVYSLQFSNAGDWICAFVDGVRQDSSKVQEPNARTLKVTLKQGANSLAVLAAHYGRQKLFGYLGPIDKIDAKGISGTVTFTQGAGPGGVAITKWRWKATQKGLDEADTMAAPGLDTSGAGWADATPGQDVFNHQKGMAWYRTTLPDAAGAHHSLHFESIDDNGTIYLNGKKLFHHEGWDSAFDVDLDPAWKTGGPNDLAVMVENTDGAGGIAAVDLQSSDAVPQNVIHGWKMRGNVDDPDAADAQWGPIPAASQNPQPPAFFRATFTAAPPAITGPHPIYRITLPGMSRGFVWLNGHNLGRYPEKVHVNGIYLPECWLKDGQNTLDIFDEDGSVPGADVKLVVEEPASWVDVSGDCKAP
jgi:beta-galactosidase